MKKYLSVLLLLVLPLLCMGQGRIYTRSARLADFRSRTTKIVLTGDPGRDAVLKEEIASRWRISPYEFCSQAEYESWKTGKLYYFLHVVSDAQFNYLMLTKGGPADDPDPLIEAMDVIDIPIGTAGEASEQELDHLAAYIDIVQEYLLKALTSEGTAYRGLKSVVHHRYGFHVEEFYIEPAPGARKPFRYRMKIDTRTHHLYGIRKERIR